MDDTGLDIGHNSNARSLNLQTNSLDRLTITGSGNVGIGTASPSQKLHVVGKALITDDVQLTGSSPRIDFNSNGSDALRFYDTTNATERMRITSGGNVGIGTTSPDALLNLESSTPALRITDTDTNAPYELKVDGGTFSIEEVSNSRTLMSMTTGAVITLDSLGSNTVLNTTGSVVVPNGSVGIGTTSPSYKLQVLETGGATTNIGVYTI